MYIKAIFTYSAGPKGEYIINDRYRFIDQKLEADVDTAKLLEPILVGYYGCEVKWIEDAVSENIADTTPTLAKKETSKAK